MSTKIKPLMKWAGGKTQIIDTVMDLFPKEMANYHEPFVGGGSVLLALLQKKGAGSIKVGTVLASDINANLIGLYKNVQSNPLQLIAELKILCDEFTAITQLKGNKKPLALEDSKTSREAYYYWTRGVFNGLTAAEKVSPRGSAMVLFMNKTGFHGLYREGKNGGFNIPFGGAKTLSVPSQEHIMSVSALIKDVIFTCCPFTEALAKTATGDFVYLDPPYAPINTTSFVSYTADGFDLEKHSALFKTIHNMKATGIKMLMSNASVKLVTDAFPGDQYEIKEVKCRRSCNAKDPAATATEVLSRN